MGLKACYSARSLNPSNARRAYAESLVFLMPDPWRKAVLDTAERLLDSYWLRLGLSLLIIASVLPETAQQALLPDAAVGRLDPFFLAIFGLEFLARLAVFIRRWRDRRAAVGELLLLILDLLAVISFLPLEHMAEPYDGLLPRPPRQRPVPPPNRRTPRLAHVWIHRYLRP